jgi:hypothetical protein
MSSVVQFPERRRVLGARSIASTRLEGWYEIQRRQDGIWRTKAILEDEADAMKFLADCIVLELYPGGTSDDDSYIPF